MSGFEESTHQIKANFGKRRIANFAKKNGVESSSIEIVDDIPVAEIEKNFKKNNGIKTRLYKNLTEEQKSAWLMYYDDHKQLSMKVKQGAVPVATEQVSTELPALEVKKPHARKRNTVAVTELPKIEKTEELPKKPSHGKSRKSMTDSEIIDEIMSNSIDVDNVQVPPVKPKRRRTKKDEEK